MQETLHVPNVDVCALNRAPPALSYRMMRDGLLLFRRNRRAAIEFTATAVSRYLDFRPVIGRHEHIILVRAAKGGLVHGYNPHRGALERYRRLSDRLESASAADL